MFTGLIETTGEVVAVTRREAPGTRCMELRVRCGGRLPPAELEVGDSVAVDGACLTVTTLEAHGFSADVSHETLRVTTLGSLEAGQPVNLERAMRLGDRLGGHLVSGHVDGIGTLAVRRTVGEVLELEVLAEPNVMRYLVPKGSIAVDGVSLTVNGLDGRGFSIALVPHTSTRTTLARKPIGARVNLETDLLTRSVERLIAPVLAALEGRTR